MMESIARLVHPSFYDTYLENIESGDVQHELRRSAASCSSLLEHLSEEQWNFAYAADKWTIKQVVQHLVDCELIFNYRALRIGREVKQQNLLGFDENLYAASAHLATLSGKEVLELFLATRTATVLLVNTFTEEQLSRTGLSNGQLFEAKALFFTNAGHVLHHVNVIRDRYLVSGKL